MGIYDDQIKQRIMQDEEAFSNAFADMAGVVLGSRIMAKLKDNSYAIRNALDEVLKYYGVKSVELPDGINDANEQIEYLCRPNGIMRRTVHLEKGFYKDAVGAMLATKVDSDSVVALIPDKLSGYTFLDPDTGKRVRVNKKNEKLFEKEAMAFYKPYPLRSMNVMDLVKFMLSHVSFSDVVFYCIISLVVVGVGMISPYLTELLFSDVIKAGSNRVLFAIAVFMICTTLSMTIFNAVKTVCLSRVQTRITIAVESATMMRILTLPADFFKRFSAGELTSYAENLNMVCSSMLITVVDTVVTSLFSLVYLMSIFIYARTLVIPAFLISLLSVCLSLAAALSRRKINKKVIEDKAKENGLCFAIISGIQKIKLSGAEKRAFSKWARDYSKSAKNMYNPPLFIKISGSLDVAIGLIGTIVMYYFAIVSGVSMADYYAFNSAYGMVSAAFMSIVSIIEIIGQIGPSIDAARPILETEPEVAENKTVITRLSGTIELDNISFRYSDDTPMILDKITLKIKKGQYVAIVGKTGCGKSTLMRLLLGFEKPVTGAIRYDGKNIRNIDLRSLRRKIGVVMQNGKLFLGDIYSNIVVSAPQLTLDEAWEAAEVAGIADDIRQMPMGMSTMISEGQGGISGGQKQRLMIARAVAPKPTILMLDEATSALDNITQKRVSNALDDLKCTRIVIAHRLSTIKQADRIVVLDGGKIVEDGSYEELIMKNGYFSELVSRQMVGDAV